MAAMPQSRPPTQFAGQFMPNGAVGNPMQAVPLLNHVVEKTGARVLCVADVRGALGTLNELAALHDADYILHTGDFGFYDASSLDRIAEKTLRHVAQYSPLLEEGLKKRIQNPPPGTHTNSLKQLVAEEGGILSELPAFLDGSQKLNVPVYTVWGACEDVRVLEKFRSKEYKVENLHIVDEANSRLLEIGGVKLRILGLGGAVVMHKLFDNGEGHTTIAGGQGTMWTTLLQMGELIDTANRCYDPTETRLFLTHASPAREGLLNQLSVTLKGDFSISAGLHFRYGSSYNEFSVNPSLDHYRGKLASSKAAFNDVWETVRGEVMPAVSQNQQQMMLLDNALQFIDKMPTSANGGNPFGGPSANAAPGAGVIDESAFKNMWNFNLADAAFGNLVLEVDNGRIGTVMRASGFNFAHRTAKVPGQHPVQQPQVSSGMGITSSGVSPALPASMPPTGPAASRKQAPTSARPTPPPKSAASPAPKSATPAPGDTPAAVHASQDVRLSTNGDAPSIDTSVPTGPSHQQENAVSPKEQRAVKHGLYITGPPDEAAVRLLLPEDSRDKIKSVETKVSRATNKQFYLAYVDTAEIAKELLDNLPADVKKQQNQREDPPKPFVKLMDAPRDYSSRMGENRWRGSGNTSESDNTSGFGRRGSNFRGRGNDRGPRQRGRGRGGRGRGSGGSGAEDGGPAPAAAAGGD